MKRKWKRILKRISPLIPCVLPLVLCACSSLNVAAPARLESVTDMAESPARLIGVDSGIFTPEGCLHSQRSMQFELEDGVQLALRTDERGIINQASRTTGGEVQILQVGAMGAGTMGHEGPIYRPAAELGANVRNYMLFDESMNGSVSVELTSTLSVGDDGRGHIQYNFRIIDCQNSRIYVPKPSLFSREIEDIAHQSGWWQMSRSEYAKRYGSHPRIESFPRDQANDERLPILRRETPLRAAN